MVSQHREALEQLWTDRATVYQKVEATNTITKRTEFTEAILLSNLPCRLSFRNIASSNGTEYAELRQVIKLILSNEFVIPTGSKIVVSRNGLATVYRQSGEPARYTSHQEIILELFKEWA